MGKCIDNFDELINQIKRDLMSGELDGSAINTVYLGMIVGYLATIVDQLDVMNSTMRNETDKEDES